MFPLKVVVLMGKRWKIVGYHRVSTLGRFAVAKMAWLPGKTSLLLISAGGFLLYDPPLCVPHTKINFKASTHLQTNIDKPNIKLVAHTITTCRPTPYERRKGNVDCMAARTSKLCVKVPGMVFEYFPVKLCKWGMGYRWACQNFAISNENCTKRPWHGWFLTRAWTK